MKLRRNFLPRQYRETGALLFLLICIPITMIFEFTIVVPIFHEIGSILYCFLLVLALFLVFNIISNIMAIMIVDTSINCEYYAFPNLKLNNAKNWRLCTVCEIIAPPRSWHCNTCETCILKRDHHCLFTGCCIGHRNQRYFLIFLLHFLIGTAGSTIYNCIYIWWILFNDFGNLRSLIQLIFPFFGIAYNFDWKNIYLLIFELNVIGLLFAGVLFLYHVNNARNGAVVHELNGKKILYNYGWRENFKNIFGEKWFLVWISPFIKSELMHDGVNWKCSTDNTQKIE